MVLKRIDRAWILVRRAAGIDQRSGVMGRVFAITAIICAVDLHVLVLDHQRPRLVELLGPGRVDGERAQGASRLLQAVRGAVGGGDQRRSARAGRRAPRQGAVARRAAGPVADDVARLPAPGDRQRHHLRRPARAAPLPGSLQRRAALRAGPSPRRGRGPAGRRRRRRAADLRGGRRAAGARRRADHAVAVLRAVPGGRAPRARGRGAGRGLLGGRRSSRRSTTARGWSRSATRTTRRASCSASTSWRACWRRCPSAPSSCSTRRCATSPTPSRWTRRWRCWSASRAC